MSAQSARESEVDADKLSKVRAQRDEYVERVNKLTVEKASLLAALESILREYSPHNKDQREEVVAARAAIAKATGRAL